jgi:hypothetical protein
MSERAISGRFQPLSIEVQAELIERQGLDTLLYCKRAWALRHKFINRETGELIRARCGSWSCLYCGPRKVDMWRQLVKAAEPTLFITLTQVGKTLQEAARVLTTVQQYLRRGSKGRGKNHVGARPAYPIEVFAILEEHSDFEHVGFHWHLLVKGVEFLPNQVVSDALRSATGGRSYITKTVRVKNHKAIGYVTKYLMKEIERERRGMIEEQRVESVLVVAPDGRLEQEEQIVTVERLCKAHRIRYSKHFFPERTADLRRKLFGEQAQEAGNEQGDSGSLPAIAPVGEKPGMSLRDNTEALRQVSYEERSSTQDPCQRAEAEDGKKVGETPSVRHSPWMLFEVEPPKDDRAAWERRRGIAQTDGARSSGGEETAIESYRRMKREALVEALEGLREGKRLYSRRVVSIWSYQRERLRSGS